MKSYLFFSAQYLPHMGGVENYTYNMTKLLIERKNKVTIITSHIENTVEYEIDNGIEIIRLPSYFFLNGRLPIIKFNKKTKELMKIIEDRKFDLVIINTRFYLMSLYGSIYAKKRGIKSIVIEHGSSHLTFNNSLLDFVENIYEHSFTWLLKRFCKNYYGVSKRACEWSAHFRIKSKGTLHNAIDLEEMQSFLDNPKKDYRKEYAIGKDKIIITFAGRMIKEKGIYQLVEAFSKINLEKKCVLFMAGDGEELENIQNKVKKENIKDVFFTNRLDAEHMAALLKVTDIFCLPSVSEGFPTAVLEAVSAKCFVITTFNSGAKELIEDGKGGIIIEDNQTEKIQFAIERVCNNEKFKKEAVEYSYRILSENFTWNHTVDKLESLL